MEGILKILFVTMSNLVLLYVSIDALVVWFGLNLCLFLYDLNVFLYTFVGSEWLSGCPVQTLNCVCSTE